MSPLGTPPDPDGGEKARVTQLNANYFAWRKMQQEATRVSIKMLLAFEKRGSARATELLVELLGKRHRPLRQCITVSTCIVDVAAAGPAEYQ